MTMAESNSLDKDRRGVPEIGSVSDPGSFPTLHRFVEAVEEKFRNLGRKED